MGVYLYDRVFNYDEDHHRKAEHEAGCAAEKVAAHGHTGRIRAESAAGKALAPALTRKGVRVS